MVLRHVVTLECVFVELLPPEIDALATSLLVAISFAGAFITAAMGIGGGVIMIACMATLMPAAAVIPVHGVVQIGANATRAVLQRSHIDWKTSLYFVMGSVVGVSIGGSIVVTLPIDILRAGLGLFILYTVWGPKLKFVANGYLNVSLIGLIASILTMFFGATGVFIAGLLQQRGYVPREFVGTHSICMGSQHILKIIVFSLLGFAFAEWLGLIVMMLTAGMLGTVLGSQVLNRLPNAMFDKVLKGILTLLALNLLAMGGELYSLT